MTVEEWEESEKATRHQTYEEMFNRIIRGVRAERRGEQVSFSWVNVLIAGAVKVDDSHQCCV